MNKHANVIRLSMLPGLFSAGFTVMAVEILGFRLIGKTFGSSLQVTSSLIAVYLTAMAMGHYLGGLLSDRFGGNTTFLCTIAAFKSTPCFFAYRCIRRRTGGVPKRIVLLISPLSIGFAL